MRFSMTSFMGSLIQMLFGLKKKVDRIQIRILFGLKKSTEYEYEYHSVWKYRPNTNTNIIRLEKITRIWIRILVFGLNHSNNIQIPNYSLTSAIREVHHDIINGVPHTNVIRLEEKSWLNTDTNIIRFENIDRIRIRILFGLKKSTEYKYEYYSVWKYRPNTNTNIIRLEKIDRIRIRILVFGLNYSNNIWIPNYFLTSGQDQLHSVIQFVLDKRKLCEDFEDHFYSINACWENRQSIWQSAPLFFQLWQAPFCRRYLQWCKSLVTLLDTLTASEHSHDPE